MAHRSYKKYKEKMVCKRVGKDLIMGSVRAYKELCDQKRIETASEVIYIKKQIVNRLIHR